MIRVWVRKPNQGDVGWHRAEWDTETCKVTLFTETGAMYRQPYHCAPASIEEWCNYYGYTVDEISHDAFIDAGL